MEVKLGYKQSDVGLIPEDWEVRPVGTMGDVRAGKALAAKGVGQQRPYLRTKNVFDGRIDLNDVLQMPMTDVDFSRYRLRRGDVLLNEGQSLELVGRCAMYKDEYPESCAIQNQLVRFRARDGVSAGFAAQLFRHCQKSGVFTRIALQTTSVAHLGVSRFHRLQLAWPPEAVEQEAIAEALSDADALIESLEQLLAKKRQLKEGAMQELLTGKKRLPRFSSHKGFRRCDLGSIPNGWDCIQLPSLMARGPSSIKIGPFGSALKKQYLTKEGFKVYGQENVYERNMDTGDRFINGEHFRKLRSCEVRAGDFLISMMGTVGRCMIVPTGIKEGIMDSHLLRLRLDPEKLNSAFLAQLFETRLVFDQVKQLSVGGIMEGLSSKIIKSLNLPTPTVEEQIAIAEALCDMDAEVAALDARLAKARQLKQGMMQELLTGRIRLV